MSSSGCDLHSAIYTPEYVGVAVGCETIRYRATDHIFTELLLVSNLTDPEVVDHFVHSFGVLQFFSTKRIAARDDDFTCKLG